MDFNNQKELSRYLGVATEMIADAIETGQKIDLDGVNLYVTHGSEVRTESAITKMGGNLMLSANPVEVTFANGEKQVFPTIRSTADLLGLTLSKTTKLVKTSGTYRGATFRSKKK